MVASMTRAIATVAVGEPFESSVPAFLASMTQHAGAEMVRAFTQWPPKSPSHKEHHYAFKYFALKHLADAGYRRVLWLDSQVRAGSSFEQVWNTIDRDGYLLCDDGAPLERWISDKALGYFELPRASAAVTGVRVVAGTVIGLNLDDSRSRDFFEEWGRLAVIPSGLFMSSHSKAIPGRMRSLPVSYGDEEPISTNPNVLGHRSDEACLTIMAGARGMKVNFELGKELLVDWVPDTTPLDLMKIGAATIDNNRRRVGGTHDVLFVNKNEQLLAISGQAYRQISCCFMPSDEALAHLGQWYDVAHVEKKDVLLLSRGRRV